MKKSKNVFVTAQQNNVYKSLMFLEAITAMIPISYDTGDYR